MTHRNRSGRLERAAQLFNDKQAARIVALLCAMTAKSVHEREAAAAHQTAVSAQLLATHGIDIEAVRFGVGGRIWGGALVGG